MQAQRESSTQDYFVPLYIDSLHDLASPVNQISTMFDLYLRAQQRRGQGEEETILNLIRTSTARLQNLMKALRDYARVAGSARVFRPCDANELLARAIYSLETITRESGAQVTHGELPRIECDPSQMVDVFTSLIDNAIKFRGETRCQVGISAAAEEGGDFLFAVRDNGIGIDRRHWESIFHMFSRVNGELYAGCGAGLAITHRIVEQHGGRIWVESEPGRGSIFFFTIRGNQAK